MKVSYITTYFSEYFRGPIYYQLESLSKRIKVTTFASSEKSYQYYSQGERFREREVVLSKNWELKRFEIKFKVRGLVWPADLKQLMQNESQDLIHSNEYYQPISWIGLEVAKKLGIPFVFTQRRPEFSGRIENIAFKILFNPLGKRVVYESDAIECISSVAKELLLKTFPKLDESKIIVVHNSVDLTLFENRTGEKFKEEFGIPKDKKIVLNFSRIFRQKRIDLLLRIFSLVKKEMKDAYLVVGGAKNPDEWRKIQKLTKELGLENDVKFIGVLPNERIKDVLDCCDVFCLTSEKEPFGYVYLEAMACEKPVMGFNVGGAPDIIIDGQNGYLIKFGDLEEYAKKIVVLLQDDQKRKEMGMVGRKYVEKRFRREEATEKRLKLYNSLVK
jgi:glycosyltransferase involved in cell wall biosynthesis